MQVDFTITPEAANAVAVAIQLSRETQLVGNLSSKRKIELYLSSDDAGATPVSAAAASITLTAGAAGKLIDGVASGEFTAAFLTNAAGLLNAVVTDGGDAGTDYYLNVITPDGRVHTSSILAFTDDSP